MHISLSQSFLANKLTDSERQQLAQAGTIKRISAGMVLIAEGQICDALYLLLEGTINVIKQAQKAPPTRHTPTHPTPTVNGAKTEAFEPTASESTASKSTASEDTEQLSQLKPGEAVGEIGLLLNITSPVTYQTATDCQIFVLSRSAYKQWQTTAPRLSQKLADSISHDFDQKLTAIMTQVKSLLHDHESLVETVSRLKEKGGCPESIALQGQLHEQVQECRSKSNALKRRTYSLAQERNRARSLVHNTQLLVGVLGGAIAILLVGNILGWSRAFSGASKNARNFPVVIPYITTQAECELRAGTVWAQGECLDYQHDSAF